MSAYCRLCNESGSPDTDSYVACNNCGSFVCQRHYVWWGNSKNAFCTVCFPAKAATGVTDAIEALQVVGRNAQSKAAGTRETYQALSEITHRFRDMSLDNLIELLSLIREELIRRGV